MFITTGGFGSLTRYYDLTGAFVALEAASDAIEPDRTRARR